jgi:hypothetical protein
MIFFPAPAGIFFVDFSIYPLYFKYLKVYNEDPERSGWEGGYQR